MTSFAIGAARLVVDHRNPGPEGGPTLRVRDADDRERLRFDCFLRGAHWHADPAGRDDVSRIPAGADAIDWTLAELHRDFTGYWERGGGTPSALPAADVVTSALDAAEPLLRNPPADLDDLDRELLRASRGEKWRVYPDDVLPVWVADMDFPLADPIRRVVQQALDRSDLRYPLHPRPTDLPELLASRLETRFGWRPEPRQIEILTDVVQGLYVAIDRFSAPGDGLVIQTPIYPPFLSAVRETRRRLVENPLALGPGGYEVDLDALRRAVDRGTRMLLLCNPHNPSGRVLRRAELEGIAEIALANELVVVSDEIHQDLVFSGQRHVPFASLAPEVEARTIALTSASKAFNIAGLRCAFAVFGSADLKRRFLEVPRHVRGGIGILGIEATRAAWCHAGPWLERVLAYLEANRDFVVRFAAERLPEVRLFAPEATYLAWLDCRALDLGAPPYDVLLERGGVALSPGEDFGTPGTGFARLNFATSRAILTEALERVEKALS